MSRRAVLILSGLVVAGYLAGVLATRELGLARRADGGWVLAGAERVAADPALEPAYPNLLEDRAGLSDYQEWGRWIVSGGRPYQDEHAECPPLALWVAALPYLSFDAGVERGEPFGSEARLDARLQQAGLAAAERDAIRDALRASARRPTDRGPKLGPARDLWPSVEPGANAALLSSAGDVWRANRARHEELLGNREPYGQRHQVVMAVLLVLLIVTVTANLRLLGASPAWALLLLLPGSLYFGFNRQGLVVANAVALAIQLQLRRRPCSAGAALGLALMAKGDPLVLVPAFLAQNVRRGDRARALLAGAAPLAAAVAVAAAFCAWVFSFRDGGADALRHLLGTYAWERVPQPGTLLSMMTDPERWALAPVTARPSLAILFRGMQFVPAIALAFVAGRSDRHLLGGALVATLCAVAFRDSFAPEEVLWVTLLAAHLAPSRRRYLGLAAAFEIATYVGLALLRGSSQAGGDGDTYWHWITARHVLTLVFLAVATATFLWDARREGAPSQAAPVGSAPAST